jgi:hypothetical protein
MGAKARMNNKDGGAGRCDYNSEGEDGEELWTQNNQ